LGQPSAYPLRIRKRPKRCAAAKRRSKTRPEQLQQTPHLLDHLVGASEQCGGTSKPCSFYVFKTGEQIERCSYFFIVS
jgi:hypothetical protein